MKIRTLRSVYLSLVGNLDQISSERYFVTIASLVASIFLFGLCLVHLLMGLKVAPVFLAGSSATVLLGLYLFVRFGTCLYIPKVVLTGLGLIMLDLTWYSKFLSNGPVLFFILIFAALVIWVWEGKCLAILLGYYFLNLAALGIIESKSPEFILKYSDPSKRTLDIYLSFFLYSVLLITLLYIVKREFTRQKEKAIKSDKLKSAFLANMSHEIRTPMNAIVGFSQLLGNATVSDNKQQYLDIIHNSSENLLRLINDIIDLSKIEAGDMEIKYISFSLKELFIELKDLFSLELLRREKFAVKINYILPDEDIMIMADPFRLKQIFSNLLSNSIKFTSEGSITFGCEKEVRELKFYVSDTGTGIPEEDQKKIFDRFTRFNYQGMNTEGTGIGLSIVEKLVELLNGRIWLKSAIGEGSTFFFTIPLRNAISISSPFKKQENTAVNFKKETIAPILVVEDDKTSYLLLKEILKPLNIEIHHVNDGIDAINFIKLNPEVRLILMDMKLPTMDGYQATQAIKLLNPKIPVIAQTAYAMIGDEEKAINAGCDDYLTKPLNPKKLQELIKLYLSR